MTGGPPHIARRGSNVEAWIKRHRDEHVREGMIGGGLTPWDALDGLLDDYRLHADTGTRLAEEVEGPHPESNPPRELSAIEAEIDELNQALAALRDEAVRHEQFNRLSGVESVAWLAARGLSEDAARRVITDFLLERIHLRRTRRAGYGGGQ